MIPTVVSEYVNGTIKMQRDFTGTSGHLDKGIFSMQSWKYWFQLTGPKTCETKHTLQSVMQLILKATQLELLLIVGKLVGTGYYVQILVASITIPRLQHSFADFNIITMDTIPSMHTTLLDS